MTSNASIEEVTLEYRKTISSQHQDGSSDDIELLSSYNLKIVYSSVGSVGILGNLFVFLVINTNRIMQKSLTNLFIMNQSLLDLTASIFVTMNSYFEDPLVLPPGLLRELYCKLWISRVIMWGVFYASSYNLVALTYERYFALVHPMFHMTWLTHTKVRISISLTWIMGMLTLLIYGIPVSGMQGNVCVVWSLYPSKSIHVLAVVALFLTNYFMPVCLIIYAYVCIVWVLKGKSNTTENKLPSNRDVIMAKAQRNVLKMLCIVFIGFLVCWSPSLWSYLFRNINLIELDYQGWFYHTSVALCFANCIINPFIYAFKYDEFRNTVKESLCGKKKG